MDNRKIYLTWFSERLQKPLTDLNIIGKFFDGSNFDPIYQSVMSNRKKTFKLIKKILNLIIFMNLTVLSLPICYRKTIYLEYSE